MLYLRVSLFCKTVFVTSGSQFSRGPICRTNIFQGPNLPPRGPICRGPICHHQIFRGPICRTQHFPGPNLPGPNLPGPNLPGPNLPGPNLPGPNLPQKSLGAQFARGPICLEPGQNPKYFQKNHLRAPLSPPPPASMDTLGGCFIVKLVVLSSNLPHCR